MQRTAPLANAQKIPFDAVIAASGNSIEGPPGMGFVLDRKDVLEKCAGNSQSLSLDLHDQWVYMEKTTLGQAEMRMAVHAMRDALQELGISHKAYE